MVSVCIATYNGEKYIKEQLLSILSQIGEEDEVIVSDDDSTDGTLRIIGELKDARIKIFHSKARNVIKNFENALMQAKGDRIFLSDQDDVWLPEKYKTMTGLLSEYDLVISDSVVTDEQLNVIEPSFFRCIHSGKGILKNIKKSTYYGSCMAFRRKVLEKALPFPDTTEIGHDLWIGLVAELTKSKVIFTSVPLILYRRHDEVFCNVGVDNRSSRSLFQKIKGRIIMLRYVSAFYLKYKFSCKKV